MHLLTGHDLRTRSDLQLTVIAFVAVLAYMLFLLNLGPSILAYALALAVLFCIIVANPEIGIYTALFGVFLFEKFFTLEPLVIGVTQYKFYFIDFVIAFTLCGVLLQWLRGQPVFAPLKTILKNKPFLLFLGVVLFTFVRSFFIQNASFALNFSALKNYALYSVVFFLVIMLFGDRKKRNDLFNIFLWSGLAVLVFLVIGFVRGQGLWVEFTPLSTAGTRLIGGPHAFYLALTGLLVMPLVLLEPSALSITKKRWLGVGLGAIVVAVAVSLVRHLWLSLAVTAVFWLWKAPTQYIVKAVRAVCMALFAGVCVYLFAFLFAYTWSFDTGFFEHVNTVIAERTNVVSWVTAYDDQDTSIGYRYVLLHSALTAWIHAPVFGIGFGQLLEGDQDGFLFAAPVRDAHNDYVGILVQMGVLGFAVVVWWFGRMAYAVTHTTRDVLARRPIMLWLSSVMIVFMTSFAFTVLWDINTFNFMWWLIVALWTLEYENPAD